MHLSPGTPCRLLILVRSFSAGGAERQLLELLKVISKEEFRIEVLCFYRGAWHDQACAIPGIHVRVLDKRGRYDVVGFTLRLLSAVRRFRPDVVYGYMFVADVLALMVGLLTGSRVAWGLRSSSIDATSYDRFTSFVQWLSRRLARFAHLVIANSARGLADYVAGGAQPHRSLVIHNGIDPARFRPDPAARKQWRHEWGRSPNDTIIGLVARIDPMKGHDVFLRAAGDLLQQGVDAWFVCAGSATAENAAHAERMRELARDLGIAGRVVWIGQVEEIERVYPAFDIATSASGFGEGFSNSIAEAMACGVPCVVTDVGDSAEIVGSLGIVIPPFQPSMLAAAWKQLLAGRDRIEGEPVRSRIIGSFSVGACVAATERALLGLVAGIRSTN